VQSLVRRYPLLGPFKGPGAHKVTADQRAHKGTHKGAYKALYATKSLPVSASERKVCHSKRQWAHKGAHKGEQVKGAQG